MYNRYWKEHVNIFVPIIYVGGENNIARTPFSF